MDLVFLGVANKKKDKNKRNMLDYKALEAQTLENVGADSRARCFWCNLDNPVYVEYHDKEWGVPLHDDAGLFELLLLESFQAGLSWEIILNKREDFRKAFDGFDYVRIAQYDDRSALRQRGEKVEIFSSGNVLREGEQNVIQNSPSKIEELMHNKGIIRNRLKISAAVTNARVFMDIQKEYGSFDAYIWGFTGGEIIYEWDKTSSPLSDAVSIDLKKRGMKFVGTTIIYSYLQAIGIINSHFPGCFLHQG